MSWSDDEYIDIDDPIDVWSERMQLLKQSIWLDATRTEHPFAQMEDSYILNCIKWSKREAELAQDEYDYYSDWDEDVQFRNEEIDSYIEDLNHVHDVFEKYYNERIESRMISWE